MVLNEDFDFASAHQDVKRAFLRSPERTRLTAGTQLYKWTDRPLRLGAPVSPWWCFVEAVRLGSGAVVEGFKASEELAERLRKTHREYARARAAISDEFGNRMGKLLVVALNVPVWGFAGQASGQPEFEKEASDLQHVYLIGGAYQLWIPNLAYSDVRRLRVRG